jgi:hypothetical protein
MTTDVTMDEVVILVCYLVTQWTWHDVTGEREFIEWHQERRE